MTTIFSIICFILMAGRNMHEDNVKLFGFSITVPMALFDTLKSLGNYLCVLESLHNTFSMAQQL